jgi:hypothetical protein
VGWKKVGGVQRYFALRLLYHTPETLERAGKKIAFSLFMCRRRVQKLFPLADKTGERRKKETRTPGHRFACVFLMERSGKIPFRLPLSLQM